MVLKQFGAMFKARTMEFLRDRGTFFWNLLFPFIVVFGFAFAFSGSGEGQFKVGTIGQAPEPMSFLELPQIQFIPYSSESSGPAGTTGKEAVLEKLRRHELDMVIDFDSRSFAINRESQKGPVLKLLFEGQRALQDARAVSGSATSGPVFASGTGGFTEVQITGQAIKYSDWVLLGVIGMNMMFSCLFGVGFVLVRYRKNGVLKRMKATPVSALNFVSAQAASRLIIAVATSVLVFAGAYLALRFMMLGSWLNLLVLTVLTALCLIALGLVFASRMKSEELAGGLLNVVTFPMILMSGVFYSLEGAPVFVQNIAKIFPLTHFLDAGRKIMLEGADFLQVLPSFLYLIGLTLVLLLLSAFLFKWE